MKRFLVLVAVAVSLVASGCGQPEVVAEAALTEPGTGERVALSDLPVRLLPYNRDAIFDSLEAAYPEPEPPIPPEIMQAQQQVQQAQSQWRSAQERWDNAREELRLLSEQLRQMESQGLRATPQYAQAFARFNSVESAERTSRQQMEQAFSQFDQLQQQTLVRADSIRVQRENWADQAFREFNQVVAQKLRESGREEIADTTNSQGIARIRARSGQWWLYARYTLPYEELYWNLPVEVSGDSTHVPLSRDNAQVRPIL
jgi:hypothetical protein